MSVNDIRTLTKEYDLFLQRMTLGRTLDLIQFSSIKNIKRSTSNVSIAVDIFNTFTFNNLFYL